MNLKIVILGLVCLTLVSCSGVPKSSEMTPAGRTVELVDVRIPRIMASTCSWFSPSAREEAPAEFSDLKWDDLGGDNEVVRVWRMHNGLLEACTFGISTEMVKAKDGK